MCQHHPPSASKGRAVSLDHGAAHDHDHATWTRRDFLATAGLLSAGATMMLGNTPVRAMGHSPLMQALSQAESDRVVVLVQLKGGNDGLNAVVPVTNDLYYNARPTIAIPKAKTRRLDADFGLNEHLRPLMKFWNQDRMAIVQSVGYPDVNKSHFISTDTWLTGEVRDSFAAGETGWIGRLNDKLYPPSGPLPSTPPAVQVGTRLPLIGAGAETNMMMSLKSAAAVDTLAERGVLYDPDAVPGGSYGPVLSYLRSVANLSERYVAPVRQAAQNGQTGAGYANTKLSQDLSAVARLIKGRLGAKVYVVTHGSGNQGSFDTHRNQLSSHETLYTELADGLRSFFDDLQATGDDKRVILMTFSEFGRRVFENGSGGTDHGEASVAFAVGGEGAITGGFYGEAPDLTGANVPYKEDFRNLYAILMDDWLGVEGVVSNAVLPGAAASFGLVGDPLAPSAPRRATTGQLDAVYPNPVSDRTTVTFTLGTAGPVALDVVDLRGRSMGIAVERTFEAGQHAVPLDVGGLAAGFYTVRLRTNAGTTTRKLTVLR
ncbi:MAG: DUF1501 domain-containing protein [Bacteroidota bacterium]